MKKALQSRKTRCDCWELFTVQVLCTPGDVYAQISKEAGPTIDEDENGLGLKRGNEDSVKLSKREFL